MKRIWVLTDNRPGTASQALGVAEALGLPFEEKKLTYNPLAALPNALLWALRIVPAHADLNPPYPDLIISAGRRAALVAAAIKRKSKGHSKIVQIMNPAWNLPAFDLLAVPLHDDFLYKGANAMRTLGNPGRLNVKKLLEASQQWRAAFENLPSPRIGVLLGGAAKSQGLDEMGAQHLLRQASEAAQKLGGSLLISTSRRTPPGVADAVRETVQVPYYLYDWSKGGDNPYAGILALADAIIVSGDSTSMLCEACFTAKPVYIYAPHGLPKPKHARLHRDLVGKSYAKIWCGHLVLGGNWPRLAAAQQVAEAVKNQLFSPAESLE